MVRPPATMTDPVVDRAVRLNSLLASVGLEARHKGVGLGPSGHATHNLVL